MDPGLSFGKGRGTKTNTQSRHLSRLRFFTHATGGIRRLELAMIAPHIHRQSVRRHRFDILLVEDNSAQALVAQAAHRRAKLPGVLHLARDGAEAMALLRREGKFAHKPTPDLMLLDVQMPRKTGWDVLDEIKTDERLCVIPVLMLTTSSDVADIHHAYARHANAFLTKPDDLNGFIELFRAIDQFWLHAAMLPSVETQFA